MSQVNNKVPSVGQVVVDECDHSILGVDDPRPPRKSLILM